MLLLLSAATVALQLQINAGVGDRCSSAARVGRDSAQVAQDSGCVRKPRRIPLTPQHLATAFHDPAARALLAEARVARLRRDSSIVSYEARAYQRISAGLGLARVGRDRLIFRTESVSDVRWHRDVGAWVDVKGVRTVVPIAPGEGEKEAREDLADEDDMVPLPYYPGYEPLWIGTGIAKAEVDERELVHPLAEGSEAYYTYQTGDTSSLRLPDGRIIRIRELRLRPRATRWNLLVGSIWFDADRGQVVRAIYRLAEPLEVWTEVKRHDPKSGDDVPKWVMPLISPLRAQVNAIAVEYGLHQGRFWLPRIHAAEGEARMSAFRVPFKMEQSFRYTSVNALDSLPRIAVNVPSRRDSLVRALDTLVGPDRQRLRDSLRVARRAARDSIRDGLKRVATQCDTSDFRVVTRYRVEGSQVPMAVRTPCDRTRLASSPELPPSIFDPGEELFGVKERESLIAEALSLTAQPAFGPRPPVLRYGLHMTRFNRVEGLSVGAAVEQQFGMGYSARVVGRLGLADLEPNVELSLARSNLLRTIRVSGYNRLVAANDWGDPLSFGSSLGALLWGRDEGFYYRASGAELAGSGDRGVRFDWRLFAEQQRMAALETQFSLANAVGNTTFPANIEARRGTYVGSAVRLAHSYGLDPAGLRLLSDLRLEGAASDDMYGRAALDLTLSRGLGRVAGTPLAGAVTISGGTTAGDVPAQRHWYLGGTHTVRGQRAGVASGDAYWLTRAELGVGIPAARPTVFADWGWAGDRDAWRDVGRPLSGVGVGTSFVDGLVRFDVARGLYPDRRWAANLYVEARF